MNGMWKDMHVLVVENDSDLAELISTILELEGFHPEIAYDADEGLSKARESDFDLVISDVSLPDVSGLEFLKKLKVIRRDILVIMMTGSKDFNTAVKALNLGAVGFMVKPFTNYELKKQVEQIRTLSTNRRSRNFMFENVIREKHEITIETGTLMDKENFVMFTTYLTEHFGAGTGLTAEKGMQYGLAIHEALRNAVEHGNLDISSKLKSRADGNDFGAAYDNLIKERIAKPEYAAKRIVIKFVRSPSQIELKIRDEGKGFDYKKAKHEQESRVSSGAECVGRGLALIDAYMDKVSYNESGNEVSLIRSVK
jgi:DNA-binding response OmpR family regulator